ncbi:MAG TPA: hydrogenase maturation nickel metallochaperone HypA [Solirubrobacteraceae bacterium]|jgi:hydrogenase nickel incorporation protein HypA/HybF|nr:hydrogenase maturation nickel metallochaperone HypA [Solirubrobacteraceae bacterium]
MHELSIAQAIIDVATRYAYGRRVVKIEVRVGEQRAVERESLDFAFTLLTPGTALDGSELEVASAPGEELFVEALELEEEPQRDARVSRSSAS